jgi:hypothetical protein
VDLTKEFELRHRQREAEKLQKIEELYEKHDKRAAEEIKLMVTIKGGGAAESE